ncbi:MAG: hypothetical protein KF795_10240 [Labilithrix sp.]|nr:hypothetical protein [Labilithrix sp.]
MTTPMGDKSDGATITKRPGRFKEPVKWMLGRKLVLEAAWIALEAVFKRRFSGIAWMTPKPHCELEKLPAGEKELWFDYVSDTGDGQWATYRAAYLCLANLWVSDKNILSFEPPGAAREQHDKAQGTFLPRGRFLVIGSDLAYPVASHAALVERLQTPFAWALEDLCKEGLASSEDVRPMFALPGNHDYYDALGGFSAVVRPPASSDRPAFLPGFRSDQRSSYFAIALPHKWWLFGFDAQKGAIDPRQHAFFKKIIDGVTAAKRAKPEKPEEPKKPEKLERLIVATPEPTTTFGGASGSREAIGSFLAELGLGKPFSSDQGALAEPERCRLDLSGDIHHYARHWGPAPEEWMARSVTDEGPAEAWPMQANYASVQAGLGGAFLHPSHTKRGKLPAVLHPPTETSREIVNRRLLDPLRMLWNGNIGIAGALVALIAWVVARNWERLWIAEADCWKNGVAVFLPAAFGVLLLAAVFWQLERLRRLGKTRDRSERVDPATAKEESAHRCARVWTPLALLIVAALPLASPWCGVLSVFAKSLALVMFGGSSLAVIVAAIIGGQLFSELESVKANALVTAGGVGVFAAGVGSFALTLALYSDVPLRLFLVSLGVVLLVALFFGLVALAVPAGKHATWLGKAGFVVLGLLHAVLQLGTPRLWVLQGSWTALLGLVGLGALFVLVGRSHAGKARRAPRGLLVVAGVVLLAGAIGLPIALPGAPSESFGWPLALTPAAGALFSTVWFAWYLVIALAYDGHNNEAGGAVRVDSFVQILRIRVAADRLEVFAIAADTTDEADRAKVRLIDRFTLEAGESTVNAAAEGGAPERDQDGAASPVAAASA